LFPFPIVVIVVVVVVVVRRGLFHAPTVVCFGYLFRRCWQSLFIISSPSFSFSLALFFFFFFFRGGDVVRFREKWYLSRPGSPRRSYRYWNLPEY